MPRKGILIRLAIYLPVLAFLAYGAFCNNDSTDRKAPEASDGKKFQVIEVSPAEAERMMGRELPKQAKDADAAPSAPAAKTPAPAEADADAADPASP